MAHEYESEELGAALYQSEFAFIQNFCTVSLFSSLLLLFHIG